MAKYTKEAARGIIFAGAAKYKEKLSDRQFLLIYKENSSKVLKSALVEFKPTNFKHLTGIVTELSAARFFRICLDKRLSTKQFELDKYGNAQRKLDVLLLMPDVFYGRCWIGESINNDIYINADYYVGDTHCVLSVGIRKTKAGDIPITLKKQSIREVVKKESKVFAIASKFSADREAAWELTYCDKDFNAEAYLQDMQHGKEFPQIWSGRI